MLEELGKDLWNVALAGIGAVAIVGEKAYEFGRSAPPRAAKNLEKGKAVSEDLRRKGEQIAQERREKYRQEALERLTAEERDALRAKLAELDARRGRRQGRSGRGRERIAAEMAAEEKKVIDFRAQGRSLRGMSRPPRRVRF